MAISQVKVTSKIERSFKVEVDASHSFIIDQPPDLYPLNLVRL